jgi:hypothetical protein
MGRACPFCPDDSDINLFGNRERVVHLDGRRSAPRQRPASATWLRMTSDHQTSDLQRVPYLIRDVEKAAFERARCPSTRRMQRLLRALGLRSRCGCGALKFFAQVFVWLNGDVFVVKGCSAARQSERARATLIGLGPYGIVFATMILTLV